MLGGVAGWLLVRFFFDLPFTLPWLPLLGFGAAASALAIAMGVTLSREALRQPPLVTLRENAL